MDEGRFIASSLFHRPSSFGTSMNDEPPVIYGIIGNPLSHTLSPLMHNAAFKALKVNAVYKPFPIEEDELQLFIEDLKENANPIFGLNVTIPYKEKKWAWAVARAPTK